jgi:hypothetical protein
MARETEPHPDTDQAGETIEFEPVPPPDYVWVEASHESEIVLAGLHEFPVEIRVGQTAETSPLFLYDGWNYRELCKAQGIDSEGAYVLVQPDVMADNPQRGWIVIPYGEKVTIGRAKTPQFRLGNDVAREEHLEIENKEMPPDTNPEARIVGLAANPIRVRVKGDFFGADHRFLR